MQDAEDLHQRLLVAAAQLSIGEVDPRQVVMLACDLLAQGGSGEATLTLAIQSPARLAPSHAGALVREMLAEWGVEAPAPSQGAEIVALGMCRRLLDGTLRPAPGAYRLLGVLAQCTNRQQQVNQLLNILDPFLDDVEGRGDDFYRADVQALARAILRGAAEA